MVDFISLVQNTHYKNLEAFIKRKLDSATKIFGTNSNEIVLFYAYLIVGENYSEQIEGVSNTILQIIKEPHKFWLSGNTFTLQDTELKTHLIRYIILNHMELFVVNASKLENKAAIEGFISLNRKELERLLNQKEQLEIEKILENSHSFTELINKDTFSILRNNIRIIAACSMAFMISLNFVYINFYYHLKLFEADNMEEMSFLQRRSRNRGAAALTTVGFFLIFYLAYNISKILFRNIKTNPVTSLPISIDMFILKCRENNHLLPLIPDPYKKIIDDFWFRNVSLNYYLPRNKRLFIYRQYINLELEYLKNEMQIEQFIMLLTGLGIEEKVPNLSDLAYDVPLAVLRDPESHWTKNTGVSHLNCKSFLQLSFKIAVIEKVIEELNDNKKLFSNTRANILEKLIRIKESLKLKVTHIKIASPVEIGIENFIRADFHEIVKRIYILFWIIVCALIKLKSDQNNRKI